MEHSLTDRLCTHCALCCDGSLFADVELTGSREATRLEAMGLEVDDGDAEGALLVLRCRAVGVEQAEGYIAYTLARIGRVKQLLADLGHREDALPLKERVAEALA